jgi:hypothetical protein
VIDNLPGMLFVKSFPTAVVVQPRRRRAVGYGIDYLGKSDRLLS